MADFILGTEIEGAVDNRSQVYKDTHDGEGRRLPHMYRSFISFSYGGKWIEDFGLVAVTDGDRLSHAIYADFTDITHDPEVYDGQHYWDTHLKANAWDLKLATDGITERQLDEFRRWFAAGKIRELILAEHPNRGIMARVSAAPSYSMLPFEEDVEMTLARTTVKTKTTLYKGEITLSFVMDDPYWYSIKPIFLTSDTISGDGYEDSTEKMLEMDMYKVCQEDGVIPAEALKMPRSERNKYMILGTPLNLTQTNAAYMYPKTVNENGVALEDNMIIYMYYCGTAPCKPILKFGFTPRVEEGENYIKAPKNSITNPTKPYTTISFKYQDNTYDFNFTTPGIYTGYNQAIQIFDRIGQQEESISWEELRTLIRDNVKHYAPRAFAMRVIDVYRAGSQSESAERLTDMLSLMQNFLRDANNAYYPASIEIDSKTGRAFGNFSYTTIENFEGENITYKRGNKLKEDVGDMVKSEYIKLEDRNRLNDEGRLAVNENYSYAISHDYGDDLTGFNVLYQNLYY